MIFNDFIVNILNLSISNYLNKYDIKIRLN